MRKARFLLALAGALALAGCARHAIRQLHHRSGDRAAGAGGGAAALRAIGPTVSRNMRKAQHMPQAMRSSLRRRLDRRTRFVQFERAHAQSAAASLRATVIRHAIHAARNMHSRRSKRYAQPQYAPQQYAAAIRQRAAGQGGPYAARLMPMPTRRPRAALHARCRRPFAHRGVRTGRHFQFLHRRCRRQCEPAADRHGAGARLYDTATGAAAISERLKQGFVREPHVSVEVEAYRPFFILGEVTDAGPVSLRRQHDGGNGDRDCRRLCPARRQEET